MRTISEKEYCHDKLGERFEQALSRYDTQRRVEILIDRFLGEDRLAGREALDVGAGLGYFSKRMKHCGAHVTACDIGSQLLKRVEESVGCRCERVDVFSLAEHFGPASFDVVVSSECIEHTPDPARAVEQMCHVLKPGGWLALSTPNVVWSPVVKLATALHLRPFDGLENFSSFGSLQRVLETDGVDVMEQYGLHLFPFQLPLHKLSRWTDDHLQVLKRVMINICVLGRKRF